MILRASLDTAVLMLDYARWPVKEDDAAKLVMDKKKDDNEDRAITPSNPRAYIEMTRYQADLPIKRPGQAARKILSRRVVAVSLC